MLAKVRIGSIVLRVDDLRRETEFWTAALDYVPREPSSEDFVLLRPKMETAPTCLSTGITQNFASLHEFILICIQITKRTKCEG